MGSGSTLIVNEEHILTPSTWSYGIHLQHFGCHQVQQVMLPTTYTPAAFFIANRQGGSTWVYYPVIAPKNSFTVLLVTLAKAIYPHGSLSGISGTASMC